MKINYWLAHATKTLDQANIDSARLDALILLEDILGKDRGYILAHPEDDLDKELLNKLSDFIDRRCSQEPLAYIRGYSEFYGRKFIVSKEVLVPRPESETMIELLKGIDIDKPIIADIGTGSGALAITAKLEIPGSNVYAVDIDPKCLETSKQNATNLRADITLLQGDLLNPLSDIKPEILLANLPYVPNNLDINQPAKHEPRLAIFGGNDGLDYFRQIFDQIKQFSTKPKYLLTESLELQHNALKELASHYGYKEQKCEDLIQQFSYLAPSQE